MRHEYDALVAARKACRICIERYPGRIRNCAEFDYGTHVFAVGHPGPLGRTNRPLPQQLADWRDIGAALSATLEAAHHPQYGE